MHSKVSSDGCQVTSRPRNRFSRYSKWLDTFRTDLVYIYIYNYYVTVTGIANAMGWFIWCFYYWKSRPYVWRCALFVFLVGVCMIFEVLDFPPLLWIIDAHSLWHLATAGLPFIFYRYVYILRTVWFDYRYVIYHNKSATIP